MTTAAVVLAAGLGRRFDHPQGKLRAPARGRPLVAWALDAAAEAGIGEVLVVVGEDDLSDLLPAGARVVVNPDPAAGQATSLACGVRAARAAGHDAVVVGLADQPGVPAEAWRRVAASPSPVATATFGGARRPPVRLDAAVWPLLPQAGDEGARVLLRQRPDLVAEVPCPGDPTDVDTLEDLERWT
ncbi:MAG: nucleotidyltransferase family protein [Acidimicrobiales bacterium]|nr:nucleotidyltransferase family protein [Acidimicrobiales bacterium]MCB9373331.1 nucleotidyltransferase family protein [Microthrixaceae bacterium]